MAINIVIDNIIVLFSTIYAFIYL